MTPPSDNQPSDQQNSTPWTPPPMRTTDRFPDYGITSDGRVFSLRSNWRGQGVRELAQDLNADGYRRVRILDRDGKRVSIAVHRLVAPAYLGGKPPGFECCHVDGDRLNNDVANLRWGSRSDNARDRVKHGRQRGGIMETDGRLEAYRDRIA